MASVVIRVDGLRELGERMRGLSAKVANKVAGQATGAAAQVVKKAAKRHIQSNPSIDTGALLNAVIIKKLGKSQTQYTAEHIVTVRGRGKRKLKGKQTEAPHARFIEFGTVNAPAEPFLRPAFDQNGSKMIDAMKQKLSDAIAKAGK